MNEFILEKNHSCALNHTATEHFAVRGGLAENLPSHRNPNGMISRALAEYEDDETEDTSLSIMIVAISSVKVERIFCEMPLQV